MKIVNGGAGFDEGTGFSETPLSPRFNRILENGKMNMFGLGNPTANNITMTFKPKKKK